MNVCHSIFTILVPCVRTRHALQQTHTLHKNSGRKLAKLAAEEAKQAAIAEQLREEEAMAALSKAAAEGKLEPAAP